MTIDYKELMRSVMQLPKDARLQFGHEVISSVFGEETPPGPSWDEAERRMKAFESGERGGSDPYEAIARVKKTLSANANKAA